MKYFLLLIFLLSFAFVYAEDFGAGETVQLYFEEEFSAKAVVLYYNYTSLVDINPIVGNIGNINILYFDLPMNSSLGVYFLDYSVGNITFNVIESEGVMRISPVYYVFEKTKSSFYVELISVKGSFDVYANATNAEPRKSLISLNEDEIKKLYVDYDYDELIDDGSLELSYGNFSYVVRLFYLEEVVEEDIDEAGNEIVEEVGNKTVIEKVPLTFLVVDSEVNLSLVYNESAVGTLKVQNTFGESLSGLEYELNGDISEVVSFRKEVVDLEDAEIYSVDFVFNENENATLGVYSGEIVFGNEDYEIKLPVVVYVNDVESLENEDKEEFVFGDEIVYEGLVLEEESNDRLLIIGIVLIVLMVFLIGVVILKLRQRLEKKFDQYIEETKRKK